MPPAPLRRRGVHSNPDNDVRVQEERNRFGTQERGKREITARESYLSNGEVTEVWGKRSPRGMREYLARRKKKKK